MTPDEHEILSLKTRLIAQKDLFDCVCNTLRIHYGMLPVDHGRALSTTLRTFLIGKKEEIALGLFVPGEHPAMSDLKSSLYQDAFESLSNELIAAIEAGLTDDEKRHLDSLQ